MEWLTPVSNIFAILGSSRLPENNGQAGDYLYLFIVFHPYAPYIHINHTFYTGGLFWRANVAG